MSLTFPEYESYDAVGLAELVRSSDVSASELLDAAIARSVERNPSLNAIVIAVLSTLSLTPPTQPLSGHE